MMEVLCIIAAILAAKALAFVALVLLGNWLFDIWRDKPGK